MNYLKAYIALCRRAELRQGKVSGYTEKHHIFPQSMFGKNKRVVILTGREHYIAHCLLERICMKRYGIRNRRTQQAICAHTNMGSKGRYTNARLYEAAKQRRSECMIGELHWNWKGGTSRKYRQKGVYNTNENYHRHTYKITSPEGQEFITKSMGAICEKYSLQKSCMCRVAKGERKQHKGWKCDII